MAPERRGEPGGAGVNGVLGWRAGAATATLSIPDGTPMAGYAAREGDSDGTLDELTVSCLVLDADGERFALIAIDLIGVDAEMIEAIAAATDFKPEAVALCASHTHSGPAGVLKRLHPAEQAEYDPELRSRVIDTCVKVVNHALQWRDPADVTFARSRADGIAANRNRPDGPFDPTVSVITVRSWLGAPIATVVHFACHPTILPSLSRMISSEFPGAIRRGLPADRNGVVLFVNGAAGDVSTRFTRHTQDVFEVERAGSAIVQAVKRAGPAITLAPRIASSCRTGEIRLRARRDIEAELERASISEARRHDASLSPAQRRIEETRAQGAELLARMAEQVERLPRQVQVCTWTLGELSLIGFPGELFASLGLELTRDRGPALLLGYTNGYRGYFPDLAAYENGTYEALASPYAPGASEELITWLRNEEQA